MNIQWYPGHMTKTKRMIAETLKLCDVVCEIIDARIPLSSRNPDINELTSGKPRVIILNRADMADTNETKKWAEHFSAEGLRVIETDCKSGRGVEKFIPAAKEAVGDLIERYAEKGQFKTVRAMVVGVPNVGKSSLINRITKSKRAKTEDRPGVTRGKQWFSVDRGLELLDTPGILWPRFDDPATGMNLAFTGAIRDEIMDIETLAMRLFEALLPRYSQNLRDRFKIEAAGTGLEMLEAAAKARGCLVSGGEIDYNRIAVIALDEFRGGKLGRITLETAEDIFNV
ncbi:MAG: ribosome biogenesis GTPase YlqF [Oscillospiraceae bacterium]|jgi:ribosome biogenesis GTPase A|nr:ribosome biogenesis GTPase YlqF [Oscillospiraceae bacterium]